MALLGPQEPSPDRATFVAHVDEHLDKVVARHQSATDSIWREQGEVGKTLITLSSGALVLSVSVVQLLTGKLTTPSAGWLLPASWILFSLVAVMGASRQAWSSRAQSFRIRLEARRQTILIRLLELPRDTDIATAFDTIIQEELEEADAIPKAALKVHDRLGTAMYFGFAFGLAALVTFAILNLPF